MKKIIIIVAVIITVIGIAFIVNNTTDNLATKTEQKQKVGATIFPLYDITKEIAGDEFEVVLLLPSGASPHTFDPQPSLIKKLNGTKAIFTIGHGLDSWSHNLVESLNIPTVVVDNNIALRPTREDEHEDHADENIHDEHLDEHDEHSEDENERDEHGHGPIDPHYWLSLSNAERIASNIAQELARLDADNASLYLERSEEYKKELQALRAELQNQVQNVSSRNIVSLHDAWEYFADEFGLSVVGTFEPSGGVSPSPKDLIELAKEVKEHDVELIFIEPQLSSDSITAFAKDHNLGIAVLDPLGGIEKRQSYIDLMRYNVDQVINSLRK